MYINNGGTIVYTFICMRVYEHIYLYTFVYQSQEGKCGKLNLYRLNTCCMKLISEHVFIKSYMNLGDESTALMEQHFR